MGNPHQLKCAIFTSAAFNTLSLAFNNLIMICLGMDTFVRFSSTPVWSSLSFLNLQVYVFHKIQKIFSNRVFKYVFQHFYFLFSFWDYSNMNIRYFGVGTQILRHCLCFFQYFFHLVAQIGSFLLIYIHFTNSPLCHFLSGTELIYCVFILVILSFQSKIFIWFFIVSISLVRHLSFHPSSHFKRVYSYFLFVNVCKSCFKVSVK